MRKFGLKLARLLSTIHMKSFAEPTIYLLPSTRLVCKYLCIFVETKSVIMTLFDGIVGQ